MHISLWTAFWLLPFTAASPDAAVQQPATITLPEAHRLALENYQVIGAMRERVEQARQGRRIANSALLPTVATQGALTHNFVSAELEFEGETLRLLPDNDYEMAVVVSQPIFSGLRNFRARRQAGIGIDVARAAYETTVQDTLLGVTRAYYGVLAFQDNVEITERFVDVTKETLRTAESLFGAGESVKTAVLRARVAHAGAQRELLETRNDLKIAKEQLALLTGLAADYRVARPATPTRPAEELDALVERGLRNRTELRGLALQRRIAELQIQRQRGHYLPDVRMDAAFVKRRASFPSDTLASVELNATWTLFDGFRRNAQVASAQSQLRELELQRGLLHRQVAQEVRTTYLEVETRAASMDMLEQQLEFATENADATQKAYRVGEATDLDIITANEALTRSERQLALATYQLELAITALERAVGTFAQDIATGDSGGEQ